MKQYKPEAKTVTRIEILGGVGNSRTLTVLETDVDKVYEFVVEVFKSITTSVQVPALGGKPKLLKGITVRMYQHTSLTKEKGKHRQMTLYGLSTNDIYARIEMKLD